MTETSTTRQPTTEINPRTFAAGFAALRIFTGVVFLSNALAKAFDVALIDLGFLNGNLITLGTARAIAEGGANATYVAPLGAFYRDVVLPNWDAFGPFLTIAELAIGLGLIAGVATRLAALGGLLLLFPIWVMLWRTNLYLWQYPAEDIVPLLLLTIVPAGRFAGLDARLAPRLGSRWPF